MIYAPTTFFGTLLRDPGRGHIQLVKKSHEYCISSPLLSLATKLDNCTPSALFFQIISVSTEAYISLPLPASLGASSTGKGLYKLPLSVSHLTQIETLMWGRKIQCLRNPRSRISPSLKPSSSDAGLDVVGRDPCDVRRDAEWGYSNCSAFKEKLRIKRTNTASPIA